MIEWSGWDRDTGGEAAGRRELATRVASAKALVTCFFATIHWRRGNRWESVRGIARADSLVWGFDFQRGIGNEAAGKDIYEDCSSRGFGMVF